MRQRWLTSATHCTDMSMVVRALCSATRSDRSSVRGNRCWAKERKQLQHSVTLLGTWPAHTSGTAGAAGVAVATANGEDAAMQSLCLVAACAAVISHQWTTALQAPQSTTAASRRQIRHHGDAHHKLNALVLAVPLRQVQTGIRAHRIRRSRPVRQGITVGQLARVRASILATFRCALRAAMSRRRCRRTVMSRVLSLEARIISLAILTPI